MPDTCKSFTGTHGICRDGFPTNSGCTGHSCHACGCSIARTPPCMDENLSAPWIDDSGRPKHYREKPHE